MGDWQDRATAYASMEEWEKRCNDYSGVIVYELANEVLRLRAAGDALAEAHARQVVVAPDPLLAAWQEARRG